MGFKSFLDHVGHDFKVGLDHLLPIAEGAGEVAVRIFAPQLGPLFNSTVATVVLAEQKYNALGSAKAGTQKMADVLQLLEPVIAQGFKDAGRDSSTPAVTKYIDSVVEILKAAPAPAIATA